jgi:hypothetical protein
MIEVVLSGEAWLTAGEIRCGCDSGVNQLPSPNLLTVTVLVSVKRANYPLSSELGKKQQLGLTLGKVCLSLTYGTSCVHGQARDPGDLGVSLHIFHRLCGSCHASAW